jgi:ribonucleoside-diphosphate reductase alpha chain
MIKIDKKIVGYSVVKDEPVKTLPPPPPVVALQPVLQKQKRPTVLYGETHKLTNHAKSYNLYLTVNYNNNKPFEVFIDGSHTDATQWVKALSRLISAMLRGHDESFSLDFIGKELSKISSDEGYHTGGKGGYVAGITQHIGRTLIAIAKQRREPIAESTAEPIAELIAEQSNAHPCPECGESMRLMDGCYTCDSCGYSKCG